MGVEIRSLRPGEREEALRELFHAAFPVRRDAAYFRWKYRDNPAGEARIAVAEQDGKLLSMACVMPLRMRLAGATVRGSMSVDIATLPEAQGRGLYAQAARHLWRELAAEGFALTCGFTNQRSTRLTLEVLGRRPVGALPLRIRPLQPVRLALAALRLSGGAAQAADRAPSLAPDVAPVRRIDRFDARFDALWQRIEPRVDVATIRDTAYLDWRYARHPERPYEILALERGSEVDGYLVWRALDRSGVRSAFVADVAADPARHSAAPELLRAAAWRARAAGAVLLALLSWPGSPLHPALRRFAFIPVPPSLFPQANVFSVLSHRADLPSESLTDPRRWWLSWGDSDVV